MKKVVNKRGQFQLPYGMIFSIFLIAVFVFVAIYAIITFLDIGKNIETGAFINDLRNEVRRVWKSSGEDSVVKFTIRGGQITHVCFYDSSSDQKGEFVDMEREFKKTGARPDHNFYFYPPKYASVYSAEIKYVDMDYFITDLRANPYCIEKQDDVFNIRLEKDIRDDLVKVSAGE